MSSPGSSSACGAGSTSSTTTRHGCARMARPWKCRLPSRPSSTPMAAPSAPPRSLATSRRANRPSISSCTRRCTTRSPTCRTARTSWRACPRRWRGCGATASSAVVLTGSHYTQPPDLLHDADLAMYHAKQQGRARFQVFEVALRESAQARLGMEADLRNALDRNELRLVFQPIVQLETGSVHAFEALLRWHRPEQGVVLPAEFVPLAEQTGLILPVGAWVLREACRYARRWQDTLPGAAAVRVSVNLSAKQLGHPGIVHEVRTA